MDAKEKIQKEKLDSILKPNQGNSEFKITIRFQKFISKNFDQALNLAKKNKYFYEEGQGDFYKVYASFFTYDFDQLHEIYDLVKNRENTKIYINNKMIPYAQDLWLFLAWFYKKK